jgi:hypothetical protein
LAVWITGLFIFGQNVIHSLEDENYFSNLKYNVAAQETTNVRKITIFPAYSASASYIIFASKLKKNYFEITAVF